MEPSAPRHRVRDGAIALAAGTMVLAASLANLLTHNDYPLFGVDTAIVIVCLIAGAAVYGLLYAVLPRWARAILEGLLAAVFVDLNMDSMPVMAIVGLGVSAFAYWRKMSLHPAMIVIGLVVLVSAIFGLGSGKSWLDDKRTSGASPSSASGSDKPAIIHLVLDEHIGIEGMPQVDGDGARLAADLRDFYGRSGFALYGGAYSEHFHTVNSIPYTFNYGQSAGRTRRGRGAIADPTAYLQMLAARGGNLTIIQSDYLDVCAGIRTTRCITYDSSSLRPTLDWPMSLVDRAQLIGLKLASLSDFVRIVVRQRNSIAKRLKKRGWEIERVDLHNDSITSTASALAAFDILLDQLRTVRSGDAIVAHLLLPHYPYLVDERCRYLQWQKWLNRSSGVPLEDRQRAYFAQIRCNTRKLQSALDAIARSPAGPNTIVIVHGDHGSRLTMVDPTAKNFGRFTDSDLVAGLSTLFAVRLPGAGASYSDARMSTARLLREIVRADFRAAPESRDDPSPMVFLDDREDRPVRRVALPSSWTKRVDRPPSRP